MSDLSSTESKKSGEAAVGEAVGPVDASSVVETIIFARPADLETAGNPPADEAHAVEDE